jgi:uncharacterized protein YecE (DUF72 family)
MVRIGCAGWQMRGDEAPRAGATHLERYGAIFTSVEIPNGPGRPPRRATYERWAASVPGDFRFAVRLPRLITHVNRLVDVDDVRDLFLEQAQGLGEKLGTLLVQLPPDLPFDPEVARPFFAGLRGCFDGGIVVEPREAGWFTHEADVLLSELRVARAVPDPAIVPAAAQPGGWAGTVYFRLHGSPEQAQSLYDQAFLAAMVERLRWHEKNGSYAWCIFDNTARKGAVSNALQMLRLLEAVDLAA